MVYVFVINAAVSLVGGLCLLLIWRLDKAQTFARSIAFSQLSNVATVLCYMGWKNSDPMVSTGGMYGIALFSSAIFLFGSQALLQLIGRTLPTAWQLIIFSALAAFYALMLNLQWARPYGWLNACIYLVIGLYAQWRLQSAPWSERAIGALIALLGLNFLHIALLGEAGVPQQLMVGTVLRVAMVMAFVFAALDRTHIRAASVLQRFEKLSETSFQGIVVTDGQAVQYVNQAALRILGLQPPQPTGALRLSDLQLVKAEEIEALLNHSQPFSEVRRDATRSDGSTVHVRLSSWLTDWDGQPAAQILILDDTERRHAEIQVAIAQSEADKQRAEFAERSKTALLKANAELESRVAQRTLALEQASLAKSQFLANMSHEIRTPMNVVLGLLQLLRVTEQSALQSDYTDKAASAAKSLLSLLNDILDFSKIDAGKMDLDIQPFEPERLMRDLSVILAGSAASKHVEVLFDLDPAIPATLMGDSMRLLQVLINLSSNALKFTPVGEVIVQCYVQKDNGDDVTLRFGVHDTGIGIAEQNRAHIFDVFSQAESSTTRRFGGSGLGLSICKRLLKLMDSTLCLESTEGQGSHFYFDLTLPRAEALQADEAHAPATVAGLSVLVVDDNADALRLTSAMAASLGWQVDNAQSGAQAIALAQARSASGQNLHQVILMDWEMDGMDGWQALEALRALYPAQKAPVTVMVSSHGREQLRQRNEDDVARLNAYLIKPVTTAMLSEAVANAHCGRSNLRASARPLVKRKTRLDGMRILLVEDNPLNQLVALELLRAEGALVEAADNGSAGVAAVAQASQPFDVVLMDMQMPVMDGCTATRAIRGTLGNAWLPVIAMTANTMQSDREACLAAGMNDHVGKPFDINYLIDVLRRHTGRMTEQELRNRQTSPVHPVAEAQPFQLEQAMRDMGDDRQLYTEVLGAYLQEMRDFPARLQTLLQAADRQTAQRMVHSLKGTSATVGALAFAEQARLLEQAIKDPSVELSSLEGMAQFLSELERTRQYLESAHSNFCALS